MKAQNLRIRTSIFILIAVALSAVGCTNAETRDSRAQDLAFRSGEASKAEGNGAAIKGDDSEYQKDNSNDEAANKGDSLGEYSDEAEGNADADADAETTDTADDKTVDDSEDGTDLAGNDPSQSDGKAGAEIEDEDEGQCVWFDPENVGYAATIPGAPNDLLIPINRFRAAGRFESGNFLFDFDVFHNEDTVEESTELSFDEQRRSEKTSYTAIIMDADKASCYAIAAKKKKAEGRGHSGCFSLDTPVRMAGGKDLPIALLKQGDVVLNPLTNKPARILKVVEGPEAKPMYEVGIGTRLVKVTDGHPFITANGVVATSALKIGSLILSDNGTVEKVKTLRILAVKKDQLVRNITIEGNGTDGHAILAGGIVTGDLYLQRQLVAKKAINLVNN